MSTTDPSDPSPPTPAQRLELAARRVCVARGQDPDDQGAMLDGLTITRWRLVAREIEYHRQMADAAREAFAWSTPSPGGLNS